ncbi:MAG: ABC transporter permease [Bacteroidia bacterium]
MHLQRIIFNFKNGMEALLTNKFRALLTSLGIIFGVAAVIAMLAIGNGAEKQILEQIKQVGSNNIVIKPIIKTKEEEKQLKESGIEQKKFSPGLSMYDAENIRQVLTDVEVVSSEIEQQTLFIRSGIKLGGKLVGVSNDYFHLLDFSLVSGNFFSDFQLINAQPVCIIGSKVATKFFNTEDPIGKEIKCGNNWLKIVGVLNNKNVDEGNMQKLSIRNVDLEIYTPVKTFLLRYKNRGLVTISGLKASQNQEEGNNQSATDNNYHQLDRLVVKVAKSSEIEATVDVLQRILLRRHNGVNDFEIIVPELLLKQEQKTKKLFNTVLGIIASISLLVGGIGIMNIMLASVLERVKEIGLRMSIGASKRDIVMQFMAESVTISVSGGIIGIFLGIAISLIIQAATDIETIVSPISVFLSFTISISVGLVFGILPAKRAAMQDPAECLR